MIYKKDLLEKIKELESSVEKLEYSLMCADTKIRILGDYADHFDALAKHLGLEFQKKPATPGYIEIIKIKKQPNVGQKGIKMIARIFRLTMSVILITFMWMDYKWALYLLVTLGVVASETTAYYITKTMDTIADTIKKGLLLQ